jgi:1-acyl-sn-glycerol-3-phosphate acyltransferase
MVDYSIYESDRRFAAAVAQNALDMVRAFKFAPLHGPLGRVFNGPARRITEMIFHYDRLAGSDGLAAASTWLLPQFTRSVTVTGSLPAHGGPVIIVSNHPGMMDAMAIFAQIPQDNLRVLAAERPILRLLPHIMNYLIFVPEDPQRRLAAVRAAAAHLRGGGMLLNFPAGQIEPDPALHADAAASLAQWADSVSLLARLAPELQVVPAAVGGVISPRALRHPLARVYRTPRQREWVAATLQVIQPRYRDTHLHLRFGEPIPATDIHHLHDRVLEQMRGLLRQIHADQTA